MPLPGADKYMIAAPAKELTWEQQVIEKANKEIRIEDVLSRYYEIYVPYDAMSWKVRCPYASEHEDGGLDKQFRIYSDSNNGYCFAMHGRIDNIRLHRELFPTEKVFDTAKSLLDDFDIEYRRKSYKEVFSLLQETSQQKTLDHKDVIEAMKTYLSTLEGYSQHQLNPVIVQAFDQFLLQVKSACKDLYTFEEVKPWYQSEKDRMKNTLLSVIG